MGAEGTAVTFPILATHANGTFTASAHGARRTARARQTAEVCAELKRTGDDR